MQTKAQLRQEMLRQRRLTPPEEKKRIDREITARLLQLDCFLRAERVFLYVSTPEEISTREILDACWQSGKIACVPKCLPGHRMSARQISSVADLTEQTYGISEPGAHCPEIAPEHIDLCIVPALACDRLGYRIGYGGGFYDRFLCQTHSETAALCASARFLDRLPTERFDIPCRTIITENEVWNP